MSRNWLHTDWEDYEMFYDPGGESSLRAGKRTEPCPTCEWPRRLTKEDVRRGYQCDACATAMERGTDIHYYEGDE